jgi:O-antigen ligase
MASVAAVCFAMFFRPEKAILHRIVWIALAFVFLLALLLSGTRGAILGFFIAAGIVIVSQWPLLVGAARRRVVVILGVMLVIATTLFTLFSFPNSLNPRGLRLAQRFADVLDLTTPAVRERLLFAGIAGEMIRKSPVLGGGPGTFRLRFYPAVVRLQERDSRAGVQAMTADLKNRVAEHAHNDYLQIWCDTGTVGFGLFLLILVTAVMRHRSLIPRVPRATADVRDLYLLRTAVFAGAAVPVLQRVAQLPAASTGACLTRMGLHGVLLRVGL